MTKLYEEIYKLKNLQRSGWLMKNAHDKNSGRVESDAEHTFSMAVLALEIINKEKLDLDTEKVLKMIVYHELGEIDVGDFTPYDNITKQEKYELEKQCIARLANENDMPEILDLWVEYEACESPEAQFVDEIDRLDAVLQSKIYSKEVDNDKIFDEFYTRAQKIADKYKKYL